MKARSGLFVGIVGALLIGFWTGGGGAAFDRTAPEEFLGASNHDGKRASVQRGREALAEIGGLTVIGHSFTQGVGVDPARIETDGMVGRLARLMGVPTSGVVNLGAVGAQLTRETSEVVSSWPSLLNELPAGPSATGGGAAARVGSSQASIMTDRAGGGDSGAVAIVHGLNDFALWSGSASEDLERAYSNALRFTISRARAATVHDDTNPSVEFAGSWVSGFTSSTGTASRWSSVSGDRFTITLPDDYQGETVAIGLIGAAGNQATLAQPGGLDATGTSITVTDGSRFTAGQVIRIGKEEMTITGIASSVFTVNRGVNDTKAATHANGAAVRVAADTVDVTWSGTAGVNGSGELAGQGINGQRAPVVHRITTLTAANAGETIIGTVGHAAAGEEIQLIFDSWWLEAAQPPPIAVANVPRSWLPTFRPAPDDPDFDAWNATTADVVAEFDSYVRVADVDAAFYERTATLSRRLDDDATTVAISAASRAFPTTGEFRIRINSEDLLVTDVSGSYPDYRLIVERAVNNTVVAAHARGTWVSNAEWFATDNLHPNAAGHEVYARLLYETLVGIAAENYPAPPFSTG